MIELNAKSVCTISAVALVLGMCAAGTVLAADCPETDARQVSTAIVYSDRFLEHDTGEGHPERPERLEAVVRRLRTGGLWDRLTVMKPVLATKEQLLRFHTGPYLATLREAQANAPTFLDPDTPVGPVSYDVARLAAGGAISAVDAVMTDSTTNAFVASRPPGHHAFTDRGSGFCLLNHVAIAARTRYACAWTATSIDRGLGCTSW